MGTRGPECAICQLPETVLIQINQRLRAGDSKSGIARDYSVSRFSLTRHFQAGHHKLVEGAPTPVKSTKRHIVKPAEKPPAPMIYGADGLQRSIYQVMGKLEALFNEVNRPGASRREILEVAKVLKQFQELGAKIEGLIKEGQVNILVNPEWINIRGAIMRALQSYPEAREAVLNELDSGNMRSVESEEEFEG